MTEALSLEEFTRTLEPKLNTFVEQRQLEKATLIAEGVLDSERPMEDNVLLGLMGMLMMVTIIQSVESAEKLKRYANKFNISPETLGMIKNEVVETLKEARKNG